MDPFLQAGLTLGASLAFLAFGIAFILPIADRIADRFERRRTHPPAE